MVPSSVYFHISVNRLCSEKIFLLKIKKNTGKVNQRRKGESVWCSKCSGSKRAQNSVFRGPSDILYQNENFLAWLSPAPPIEFSERKELGNPGDVDPGQSKHKKWRLESCMEQKLHGSGHTQPVAWGRATEAVGHKTLNSLQHHEGAAAVVICDSVALFLKINSAPDTAPL